jgi:glycosyltransferase involved in cell wall biosynthesis
MSGKRKILKVIMRIIEANKFYYLRGGAEHYMLKFSDWLKSEGHEVVPFAMKHADNLPSSYSNFFPSFVNTKDVKLNFGGVKTLSRMLYSLEARRKLASLIEVARPDVCHVHNIYTQLSPSILDTLRDQKVPTVMTVHDHHLISPQYNIWADGQGDDLRDVGIIKGSTSKFHKNSFAASLAQVATYKLHRFLKIYEHNIDLFLCPSNYMKQQLIKGGFKEDKIRVNMYGMDVNQIEPNYSHKKYALFVGRLSKEKGIETIIETAKLLPDINFKIVGRGPDMERLHHLGDGLSNIEFLGFRVGEELKELYRNATVVLLPSKVNEVFPLILLEAMSAGTPVIASHVGGVPEIVEDRINGFLISPPSNITAWTEAIMRLFYDNDFQRSLSINARTTVEKNFRIEDHHRRTMGFFEEVIRR